MYLFSFCWVTSMTVTDISPNGSLPAHGPILYDVIFICVYTCTCLFYMANGLNKELLNPNVFLRGKYCREVVWVSAKVHSKSPLLLLPSWVATEDYFQSPCGPIFCILLRHFNHCHVLSHRIHIHPFRRLLFPGSSILSILLSNIPVILPP